MVANQNPQQSIVIVGIGARTAVRLSAAAAAAAVRAGISRLCEHPTLVDRTDEPIVVAREPTIAPDLFGAARFARLAEPAMREALLPVLREHRGPSKVAVLLGLPEPRPGLPADLGDALAQAVANLSLPHGAVQSLTLLSRGSASGLAAMELASTRLSQGQAEFCLVGGVDSYLFPDTLKWMDAQGMLKSAANRNGFPPGEGAGFCLLCSESTAMAKRLPILGWLISSGIAHEENRIRTDTICVGRGLSDAIKMATAALHLPQERIDESICDMNGEPYRSAEYSFAAVRTQLAMVSFTRFVTPADCWGDVGAASGPLFANLAIAAGLRGYAKGPRTLLWASSMGGDRAAAVLRLSSRPAGGIA